MPFVVFAMGSSNYKINADIVGGSGGIGGSANYQLQAITGFGVRGFSR